MHERVRVFPQAKLNSEINARFLSNDNGDPYFLLHKCGVKIILFKLKIKKKLTIAKRVHRTVPGLKMQIMTSKTTIGGTF